MANRPPLTVVLPLRDDTPHLATLLRTIAVQADRTGSEVVVVGPVDRPVPPGVRVVHVDDFDLFRLRQAGVGAAEGAVVAIGEDHAVPRPGWCEAVIRAHEEHPDAPAVAGRLVNATDTTWVGRANFLAFAAQSIAPGARVASSPPPFSALSFKRDAITPAADRTGWLESELLPKLFRDGLLLPDADVVVDHYQDRGARWSVVNGFHSARSGYGYGCRGRSLPARLREAGWAFTHLPRRMVGEATAMSPELRTERATRALLVGISVGVAVGGAIGAVFGTGHSGERVA